jgi:hypothetical protein
MHRARSGSLVRLAAVSIFLAAAVACRETVSGPSGSAGDKTAVASVSVTPATLTLAVGRTGQLTAQLTSQTGGTLTGRTIVWTSSNPTAASISSAGLVSALSVGAATVTAAVDGKSDSALVTVIAPTPNVFSYSRELFGSPVTLSAWAQSSNAGTRQVTIGGVDTRAPSVPFTFAWGDGTTTSGFFNASHSYADASRNYVVRVTAHYSEGTTDSVDVAIHFLAPQLVHMSYPQQFAVTIPAQLPVLVSRQAWYSPPAGLVAFDDSYIGAALARGDVEYILSQAAAVEAGILENDVEQVVGGFRQVVLRDPNAGGAYSLWYTTPVAFGANGSYFQGTPGYSSLFHEMGHNFSLNAPAAFRFGGRIDGSANAIFSEAVAQMFQHAVAYEMVTNAARYGLPDDIALDIANSARASAQIVRASYEAYLSAGKPFSTWNDPATPDDETFGTFMTVARQFMAHAEQAGSYIGPLTRTMKLLRTFNQSMATAYAPQTNSAAASTFRATLMVAALSYGFQQDLRAEFRNLNFPIDDAAWAALYGSVP